MDPYARWLAVCDRAMALATEGMMTDDAPDFDWRAAFDWGSTPDEAVRGCTSRLA